MYIQIKRFKVNTQPFTLGSVRTLIKYTFVSEIEQDSFYIDPLKAYIM